MSLVDLDTGEVFKQLTEAEAEELTNRIGSFVKTTWGLLAQAHEGRADRALGYATWGDYCNDRFGISRGRSYQLLDLARVVTELEGVSTTVDIDSLGERDVRALKPLIDDPPAMVEAIEEADEDAAAEGTTRTSTHIRTSVSKRTETGPKVAPTPGIQAMWDRQAKEAEEAAAAPPEPVEPDHLDVRMKARKALDPIATHLQSVDFAALVDAYNHGDEIDKAYLPDFAGALHDAADRLDTALKPTLRGL